jgi:hypothetical protein
MADEMPRSKLFRLASYAAMAGPFKIAVLHLVQRHHFAPSFENFDMRRRAGILLHCPPAIIPLLHFYLFA